MIRVTEMMLLAFLAHAYDSHMDDETDKLVDRVLHVPQLDRVNIDDTMLVSRPNLDATMRGKTTITWPQWVPWRPVPMNQQQRRQIAQEPELRPFMNQDKHANPYSTFHTPPSIHKVNQKVQVTPWHPHSIFPYSLPEEVRAAALGHTVGYESAHKGKSVHRRRFTYATPYARVLVEPKVRADDEEDEEVRAAGTRAAKDAFKRMMEQGAGGGLAADIADEAAARAKEKLKAERRARTLRSIMDGELQGEGAERVSAEAAKASAKPN